ncbi:MAG: alpha/beta fold hydrolase [Myxococcales bacterium]|nr:alpha/beta fold hydrolase [Myxococcales bacterium]
MAGTPANSRPTRDSFDDFRLLQPIGHGGMGSVWLGHDTVLDRPVALKFLSEQTEGTQGRARLLAEGRALARIHHPNVVAVYRVGEVEGSPYIAYEYVNGESLATIERPLPWARVLDIALGLARGLAAAHRHGVLHRDIKPANVVLAKTGEPKLIDFGIAKLRRRGRGGDPAQSYTGLELAFTDPALVGTPLYMAPELWQGRPASESTDLYALGLVLHELLAGGPPAEEAYSGEVLIAQLATREIVHLRQLNPSVPAALADVIARLTATNPEERPRRAQALVDSLDAVRSLYGAFVDIDGDEDRVLLSEHFAMFAGRRGELGRHFYEHLFASHPELRPLFPASMVGQWRKLEDALGLVIRQLEARDALVPLLEDLGARHAEYGAAPEHFAIVGGQLLASLEALSGPSWSDELRRAWARAYDRVAHAMVRGLTRAQAEVAKTQEVVPPTQWNLPIGSPVTRYAQSGALSLAYQVLGAAPLDLVVIPGFVSHLEVSWEHPDYAEFLRRLATLARVILIDKRGTGLSDRELHALSLDEQAADLDAVLDAVGSDRAALFCMSTGGILGAAFAALRPDRTRALVLHDVWTRSPDAAAGGRELEALRGVLPEIRSAWGGPLLVEQMAPSRANDPAFRDWWARYLRAGASPDAAESILTGIARSDIWSLLSAVRTPTLVLHRRGDAIAPLAHARALAERIDGATLVELEGDDHLPFVGAVEPILSEVHRFLASTPPTGPVTTRLTTTIAVACHDPAVAPMVRGLFGRALAGTSAGAVDGQALTAEFAGAVPAVMSARTIVSTAKLVDLSASAAVVTELLEGAEAPSGIAARALASATPAGHVAINQLARELCRGSRAATSDDGVLLR